LVGKWRKQRRSLWEATAVCLVRNPSR